MSPGLYTLVLFLLLPGTSVFAQRLDPFFAESSFTQWAAEAARQQEIPWRIQITSSGLTTFQRIAAFVHINVDGRYLAHRTGEGHLFALLQFTDAAGRVYQDHSELSPPEGQEKLRRVDAFFLWRMFMLPGEYRVEVALYDKATGKHNFLRQQLKIEPLNKDPFPAAWRDMPTVEFLKSGEPPETYFHPESVMRLRLALTSSQKVRIEVLANLTGSGRAMVSHGAYNFNLTSLLPILKTFSQVEVTNGSLNITALDLIRRRIAFEQNDVHALDWPNLKTAVAAADPTKVDVRSLEDVRHTAAFLRGEVARLIQAGGKAGSDLPVLILISSSDFFNALDDLGEIPLPTECGCLAFYVRYSPVALRYRFSPAEFDNVQRVLKPLKVRMYVAESPQDLRKIMAEIFAEIAKT